MRKHERNNHLTIRTRIVLTSTLFFALVICGFAYLVDRTVAADELAKLDARLESHADKVATELEEEMDEQAFPNLRSFSELRTDGLTEVHVQVFDTLGHPILADPDAPLLAGHAVGKYSTEIGGHSIRTITSYTEAEETARYCIEVSAPADEMEQRLFALHRFFLIGIPLAILLIALGGSIILRRAFKPISGMIANATTVSGSNLEYRLPVPTSNDEIRQLALALNEMIARLEASFASQKQFIADASHELRTPLTVIYAEMEFLLTRVRDPESCESVRTSLEEVDRLVRLSEGMLLLARLEANREPVQSIPVRFDELLPACVAKIKSLAAAKSIAVRLHIGEAAETLADPDKCTTIVLNLLENAIKYSEPHTTIEVRLNSTTSESGQEVTIQITDQGYGIPATELPKIFDRFYRLDKSRGGNKGSGLGLAIVERLVTLQGGSIGVSSVSVDSLRYSPDTPTGTTFTVTFPPRQS